MREIRPSGSEGGVGLIPHPYPYRRRGPAEAGTPNLNREEFFPCGISAEADIERIRRLAD